MADQEEGKVTGLKKASVLLMALGTDASAQVLKHLTESEIEKLSAEIVRMRQVDPEMIQAVVEEFERSSASSASLAGKEFAARVLEQVIGPQKTKQMLQRAAGFTGVRPFEFLWEAEARVIARMLKEEHIQIIALVLINLPREKAAAVLSEFDKDTQARIARAVCAMEDVDAEVIGAIEEVLQIKLASASVEAVVAAGPRALVEILNNVERSIERTVLDSLRKGDPAIGKQVRSLMFVFEDLVRLEDRSIQTVLREVDQEDLRLALKGADEKMKELIFRNMSERAAETLKEDLELAGSVKTRDIEAAQQRMASVARRLLATGEIALVDSKEERVA